MKKQKLFFLLIASFSFVNSSSAFNTNRDVLGTGSYFNGNYEGTPIKEDDYLNSCKEAKMQALGQATVICEKESGKFTAKLRYYNSKQETISLDSDSDCSRAGIFKYTYAVARLEFECE